MVNFAMLLFMGGLIGWIASLLMQTDVRQGLLLNVVTGIVGAAIAGIFISPVLGMATIKQGVFSAGALLVSLLGAVFLLAIVNLLRRGRPR